MSDGLAHSEALNEVKSVLASELNVQACVFFYRKLMRKLSL
jgi:hypothetical protein